MGAATAIRLSVVGNNTVVLGSLPREPKVHIVVSAAAGDECLATGSMRDAAVLHDISDATVLYMHTRGVTHPASLSSNEDWTALLETYNIRHWRTAVALLQANQGLATCGVELWQSGLFPNGWHYSGNFWWATADHIRTLPDPEVWVAGHRPDWRRYYCSEQWLLGQLHPITLLKPHFVLFSTTGFPGHRPSIDVYRDRFLPDMYNCEHESGLPTRTPCRPVDLATCHGECCG
jgi:hypothetical protein